MRMGNRFPLPNLNPVAGLNQKCHVRMFKLASERTLCRVDEHNSADLVKWLSEGSPILMPYSGHHQQMNSANLSYFTVFCSFLIFCNLSRVRAWKFI